MKHNLSDKNKRRILLCLDLVSTCIAWFLASWIRFSFRLSPWQAQLYRTVLVFAVLLYLFMYTYRHVRGHFFDITEMDPLENMGRVVRDRFLLYALVALVLVATHIIMQISRKFLFLLVVLDVIVDYAFRMAYREFLLRKEKKAFAGDHVPKERIVLITEKAEIHLALARLRDGMPDHPGRAAIFGIALVDVDGGRKVPDGPAKKQGREKVSAGAAVEINGEKKEEGIPILGTMTKVLTKEFCYPESSADASFNRAYVFLPKADSGTVREVLDRCDEIGISADVCLTAGGDVVPEKMVHAGAGAFGRNSSQAGQSNYASAEYTNMKERCRVLGVSFAVTNVEAAAWYIRKHLKSMQGRYVCFCNVHTTVMAREDDSYLRIQNGAACTFADGAPIAAVLRYQGFADAERCAGPDFMDAVFRATMDGSVGHYFYGSTQETLDLLVSRLEKRYPGIRICGTYSPPFRKLEDVPEEEDAADIRRINDSGAQMIWIGLGAPKQERWMAMHEGKLCGTMFGVGAGFNFYAGNIRRAPKVIQRMGLEWLYRLFQDPRHLLHRYLVTNVKFFWYLLMEPFRRKQ